MESNENLVSAPEETEAPAPVDAPVEAEETAPAPVEEPAEPEAAERPVEAAPEAVSEPAGLSAEPAPPAPAATPAPAPEKRPSPEELLAEAHRWAVVDGDGIVHLKAGEKHGARAVAKVKPADLEEVLQSLVSRFARLAARFETLRRTIDGSTNKPSFLPRLAALREEAVTADAIGDLDALLGGIDGLVIELETLRAANAVAKEALCAEAEALLAAAEARDGDVKLRDLQRRWEASGTAGREADDALWGRFRVAFEAFRARRAEYVEARRAARGEARAAKEALCVEAEALASGSSWKEAGEALTALQERWKAAGSAGREDDQALWKRFGEARKRFYEARSAFFKKRDEDWKDNQRRKEALLAEVERMDGGSDPGHALARLKTVREEWRAIGPTQRSRNEELWQLFQKETQRVYAEAKEERSRRQSEWQTRLREALVRKQEQRTRLAESITHDEESVARFQTSIANVRPGPRADEIRGGLQSRVAIVEERLASKRSRAAELDGEIREIEKKLR